MRWALRWARRSLRFRGSAEKTPLGDGAAAGILGAGGGAAPSDPFTAAGTSPKTPLGDGGASATGTFGGGGAASRDWFIAAGISPKTPLGGGGAVKTPFGDGASKSSRSGVFPGLPAT